MLDGSTNSRLQLNDIGTVIRHLVIDNDIHLESTLLFHNPLHGRQRNVDRVGVKVLELSNRLEIFDVFLGDLGDFEQADGSFIFDNRTTLYVCLGFIRQLHEEFGLAVGQMAKDLEVDIGTQVVDVGDENVLFASGNEFLKETRVAEGVKDISVTRRVPLGLVRGGISGDGEERVFVDTWVSGLVKGEDLDIVVGVFLDDALGVLVRIERVHQNERNVDLVFLIEVLRIIQHRFNSGSTIISPQFGAQRDPRMSFRHELQEPTWGDHPYP